ncbi:MAG: pilus assembly protein PilM [Planctomycetota bacterium]
MFKKLFKSAHILSVEVSNEFLKLVYLSRTGQGKVFDLVSHDIRTMTDEDISNFIKTYLEQKKIQNIETIVSIPARFAITKNIEVPSTDQNEIKEIIQLQAGRHTPYSREEIFINYISIGEHKGGYTRVLLVIVNRDIIKRNLEILEKAGLAVKKFVLAPEIFAKWYAENTRLAKTVRQSPAAIIYCDYNSVDVIVVRAGNPIFVRSIPIGHTHLAEESHSYKERFLGEIKSSFETFQSENIEKLNKVIIAGATTELGKFIKEIEAAINLPVETLSYYDDVGISGEIENKETLMRNFSFLSTIAAPFEYKKVLIDLTPEELKIREAVAEKNRDIILVGTLIILILVIVTATLVEKAYVKNNYFENLKKIYDCYHEESVQLRKQEEKITRLKKHLNLRFQALDALDELINLVPQKIYLRDISFNRTESVMTIQGTSQESSIIYQLAKTLEESSYFSEVKDPKIDQSDFTISFSLESNTLLGSQ